MPRKLTGASFVSTDGVMQAPGGVTEDSTGGFDYGGWLTPYAGDPLVGATIEKLFTPPYDLLLGRRTYEIFAAYWPFVDGPEKQMGEALTAAPKHVLTHSDKPLGWENSHRLADIDAIARLKESDGADLLIQGSSTLYPQLLAAGLIDRLVLMIFPIVLGSGKRLFDGADATRALTPVSQDISENGIIVAHYEPAGIPETATIGTEMAPSEPELDRRARMQRGDW